MKIVFHRLFAMTLLLALGVGCGPAVTPATAVPNPSNIPTMPVPAATLLPSVVASPTLEAAGTPDLIKIIFTSAPGTTPDPIQFRLKQANFTACDGKFRVQYERWDNSSPDTSSWDAKRETQNAQKAISDPDVMIYLGPTYSGAAKISIPILNRANMLMISPSATLPGLTKPNAGEPGEPDVYYPTGKRNFVRVVPSDDIQGSAGAVWAKQLGSKAIYILNDEDAYGKTIVQIFKTKANALALKIIGNEVYDKNASDYKELTKKIMAAKADLVYLAGVNNLPLMIRNLREGGYNGAIMGPDSLYDDAIVAELGPLAEGLYTTFGTVPANMLVGKGKQFYEEFTKAFNQEPEGYTPFYYDATSVALAGIEKVCAKDRAAIRDAVMGIKNFEGTVGTWSFDANGDTTLTTMSGLQVRNGKFEDVIVLQEGK